MEKIFSITIMRPKLSENKDTPHSTPDIYSTPILSERPSSTTGRSITHVESLHQIAFANKKPISSIPSDLQLQSHETMSEDNSPASTRANLTIVESNDSCIYTQSNSERALSETASNKNFSELNGNSIASSSAADESASLQSSSTTHVKTKKPKFKLFDKRKLSYLSFRKNKAKKNE